ncbi:MAG: hypothetical protein FJX77_04030 [Armatimonadetes bacterium]|nr:hypothetical protein [Armatimonadota bacterium]
MREVIVGDEPVSVAIDPNGTNAYVACSASNTVAKVSIASGRRTANIQVGAEPMGVVVSPNGSRLYVANAASNSISVFETRRLTRVGLIDLSAFGSSPRALALTNDGDRTDNDETLFVAMFFGQLRPGKGFIEEGQDDQREGRVLAINTGTNAVQGAPIALGPLANTGFNSNGMLSPGPGQVPAAGSTNPQTFTTPTGAFPNQLADIAIRPNSNLAYVVSTGASPNGPLRFNSNVQGLVSVFNTGARAEITAAQTDTAVRRTAPLNLNQGVNLATAPLPRLFMSNPVAMAWRPNGADAWVVIQNSDLVVRLTVDNNGIPTVGNPLVAQAAMLVRADLQNVPAGQIPGKAPRGIVINKAGTFGFVSNFVSRSISVVDLNTAATTTTLLSTALPAAGSPAATLLRGAELFYTGRGPEERMSNESWGGCVTCHPQGRADNVTWMFDAGPRQTINLDGMFTPPPGTGQRLLNWSAVRDENHDFELNTRGVFGGRGLIDDDRQVFVIGGIAGTTDLGSVEQFHQVTGATTATNILANNAAIPTLPGGRRAFATATLTDDRVYLIGGVSGIGPVNLVTGADAILEFNPRTNVLRRRSSTGFTPRHSLGAAAVNTSAGPRIYAIGGYNSTNGMTVPVSTVEEYNPATDTWRTVANLPEGGAQFGITTTGGTNTAEPRQLIHVVSGNFGSEAMPNLATGPLIQRYQADPTGPGTWSTFNPTGLTRRRNHGAATAFRGVGSRVFIIGGENAAGAVLDTVEEYLGQGVTPVMTPHTSLPAPRARFGIGSTLSTNQIYVIGGQDGAFADQTTIFEYTVGNNGPVAGPTGTPSGSWATRGNLASARHGLSATSPPGVTNFLAAPNTGRSRDQDAIAEWIRFVVRPSRAPVPAADPAATRGRTHFGQEGLVVTGTSCATCHGGARWTRSSVDYTPPPSPEINLGLGNQRIIGAEMRQTVTQGANVLLNVGTFTLAGGRVNEIRSNAADISQAINPLGANGFNIPSLLSVHETAPYYYSGLAQTLEETLNGSRDTFGGTRHHFVKNPVMRADLIAFLRSIDQTTPIFP